MMVPEFIWIPKSTAATIFLPSDNLRLRGHRLTFDEQSGRRSPESSDAATPRPDPLGLQRPVVQPAGVSKPLFHTSISRELARRAMSAS